MRVLVLDRLPACLTLGKVHQLAAAIPQRQMKRPGAPSFLAGLRPPLEVPAVRVPALEAAVDRDGHGQAPAALAQQVRQQAAVSTSLDSRSVAGFQPVPLSLTTGQQEAVAAPTHQEAAEVAADTRGVGKLEPPAAGEGVGGGGSQTAAHCTSTSTGGGSNDADYNVRAQGREAALCEDVLAAAIAAARASAQAAFFSPGAPRALLPRQASHSGRASSSGTPASHGTGGGAQHRQPHVVGGVSAASAPYLAYSPGAVTPGTGTAASSVRSGYSPVRSPYDRLLHGGLTSAGPAAVLLPVGPGSDADRSVGVAAAAATAARTAWSTTSTAGGSSAGGGGGGSRGRGAVRHSADAMGAEFFRRNNLLQRKRQQWAAQGQREREGGSGVSIELRLTAPSMGAAAASRSQLPRTADVKMGAVQPLRSLEDLQRWAERRDQRLAVLREEREEAERAALKSHPFRPTITERSRRMVEAARARSPDARARRPWAAFPVPETMAPATAGHNGGSAANAEDDTHQVVAQPEAPPAPQQPLQPQPTLQLLQMQQQAAPAIVAVPAPASDDLLNALRGSRPWHTPPQAAAATAAAASLRSSVAAAAAAELLNGQGPAPSPGVHGANRGSVRTHSVSAGIAASVAVAETPGKGAATKARGRAGGSDAEGGGGTSSAAALLTAARHSKSRGRYALAADSEAVVGAVAEAIKDAAAALRRNVDGSISPRRSASSLAPQLHSDAAACGRSGYADAMAQEAAIRVGTKRRQEPHAAARHAPGHVGGTPVPDPALTLGYPTVSELVHQLQPHHTGSYVADYYGAHQDVSASIGLYRASQSPTFGAQPDGIASTYCPVLPDATARGFHSSGGGGSSGGVTPPYTVMPDPRQSFPGYGAISNNGSNAMAFGGVAAEEAASRPVSNGSWAGELLTGSRGGSVAAETAASVAAAAPVRQSLAAGSGSQHITRSSSGAGGAAVVAIIARRRSTSGGTGGGSGGGAPPGIAPVQAPPSSSPSPTPVFMSPVSAVRGSNHNSSRMSRARVSWRDLVSGGSGGGAAGMDSGSRRSAGGTEEAAGPALITQPATGSPVSAAVTSPESFGGALPQVSVMAPASAGLQAGLEPPVATSSFVLPLGWQQRSGEVGTPRAALHRTFASEQQQQLQQQGHHEATSGAPPPTGPTPDTLPYSARSRSGGSPTTAVTADAPGVGTNGSDVPVVGERTGTAGAVAATVATATVVLTGGGHAAAGPVPVEHEATGNGASDRPCSNEPSGCGAASEPSFTAMHAAVRSITGASSSSGGGASSGARGRSPGAGIASVFGAALFNLDRPGNDGGQAQPSTPPPPPQAPAPEEQSAAGAQQRRLELEGQKDSLAAALEAALMTAAAAAAAASASAEKGRKLAEREAPAVAAATDSAVASVQPSEVHVSQKALATAAAIAMRARSEALLQTVSPGAAVAASAALGLSAKASGADGNRDEVAVCGLVGSDSGPILTMQESGPAGVSTRVMSTSAGGMAPAAPPSVKGSVSVASGPRDARGVAFARLPGSNPSSATSTPRKLSASLSMLAAHSLAAMAALAAAGGNLSAGGTPPSSPPVNQHSATLRAYASVGGAPDVHPRPASPLRPVGSARKHGLALPPGVDGITLSSTPPASPPIGVICNSVAMAAAAAQGAGPSGASSSRPRSSLLSAGGSVDRLLVKAAVTSPQEQAQAGVAEGKISAADRSAGSLTAALALAGLRPQLEQEEQQWQRPDHPQRPEQQVQLSEATHGKHDEDEHGSLSALLRQIEALRCGSAAAAAAPMTQATGGIMTSAEPGPAAGAAALLAAPVHSTASKASAVAIAEAADSRATAEHAHSGIQLAEAPVRLSDCTAGTAAANPLAAASTAGGTSAAPAALPNHAGGASLVTCASPSSSQPDGNAVAGSLAPKPDTDGGTGSGAGSTPQPPFGAHVSRRPSTPYQQWVIDDRVSRVMIAASEGEAKSSFREAVPANTAGWAEAEGSNTDAAQDAKAKSAAKHQKFAAEAEAFVTAPAKKAADTAAAKPAKK
ncbi:hypothetical protein HYH02_012153 [Chlamydomonas schloesseri]|uniref:Uncharacterized protein n=1 Tax=Chlamydomonas schloesseri TaxID=2026947 RepID=A0A835T0R8_9CHLO|nr:hypothetical protein HYH02_012153 [Chlamydomonas schloesseri]|eukprot:KAG2434957.1 hypothetical protein HYH02_012153 [Chlamydomonas schloesseri]